MKKKIELKVGDYVKLRKPKNKYEKDISKQLLKIVFYHKTNNNYGINRKLDSGQWVWASHQYEWCPKFGSERLIKLGKLAKILYDKNT